MLLLGFNVILYIGQGLDQSVPFVKHVIGFFAYLTGSAIEVTGDVVGGAIAGGGDVVGGTIKHAAAELKEGEREGDSDHEHEWHERHKDKDKGKENDSDKDKDKDRDRDRDRDDKKYHNPFFMEHFQVHPDDSQTFIVRNKSRKDGRLPNTNFTK